MDYQAKSPAVRINISIQSIGGRRTYFIEDKLPVCAISYLNG